MLRHDLVVHVQAAAISGPPPLPSPPPTRENRREEHEHIRYRSDAQRHRGSVARV